jgi:protein SCO1/2
MSAERGRHWVRAGLVGAALSTCAAGVIAGEHAGGHAAAPAASDARYQRSVARLAVPDVELVDRNAARVVLPELLGAGEPVMLNFIFTSCTTVCPVASATFAAVQRSLGAAGEPLRLVSVSVDPEHDTPARLAEYARKLGAAESWHFLTGDPVAILRLQQAFAVYRGSKMSHVPATFLRASTDEPWIRIDGFPSSSELVAEYRALSAR